MNVYMILAALFTLVAFTAGSQIAFTLLGAVFGIAVIAAAMTSPIWITYYIVKFLDSVGKRK